MWHIHTGGTTDRSDISWLLFFYVFFLFFIFHVYVIKGLNSFKVYLFPVACHLVITELDGLSKGQECRDLDSIGETAHARMVQEFAKAAVAFLEKGFEAREPGLRALTSRGNQLESIAFRSEDTSGHKVCEYSLHALKIFGVINCISCCLYIFIWFVLGFPIVTVESVFTKIIVWKVYI